MGVGKIWLKENIYRISSDPPRINEIFFSSWWRKISRLSEFNVKMEK